MTGQRASRHGRRVVDLREALAPRELPWMRETAKADLAAATGVDVMCPHGVADLASWDTPRALRPRQIAQFARLDPAEPWSLWRPSRSAQQGPPTGRRPGTWRFACPVCDRPRLLTDRKLQARLSALVEHGVSLVELDALTL